MSRARMERRALRKVIRRGLFDRRAVRFIIDGRLTLDTYAREMGLRVRRLWISGGNPISINAEPGGDKE